MLNNSKEQFEEIFLAVLGITPQVLTECLYYYYSDYYKQNRHFDSITVFTTTIGEKELIKSLFVDEKLKDLEKHLHLTPGTIPFNKKSIKVLSNTDGTMLEDMRTTKDNESAHSFLLTEVKRVTSDPGVRVTATVAGGRKTMSSYMALAFQLYGRRHDELIHILAPEGRMQKNSNWFFPKNPEKEDEKLFVSHIPILRVGRYLRKSLDLSPDELFTKLQNDLASKSKLKKLVIKKNEFCGDGSTIKIQAKPASYLIYLLKKRLSSGCKIDCKGCTKCFASKDELVKAANNEILKEHEFISGEWDGYYLRTKGAEQGLEMVNEIISRLRKIINDSQISLHFKNSIRVRSIPLDPDNNTYKWHGIVIDKTIVTFNN